MPELHGVCWRTPEGFLTTLHIRKGRQTRCGKWIGSPNWESLHDAKDAGGRPTLPSTNGDANYCTKCFLRV